MKLTKEIVFEHLKKVIDPELNIDIVSLGLVYDATVSEVQTPTDSQTKVHVVMTLTTPGCPLSHVFESKIKEALSDLPGMDAYRDVTVELTFDPPWIPDMMSPESRAELGF
jgi:metal-sulfur cluster biosynthetic enzyme